ncbi:MAG: redoxin domain-containing protein [Pseudomonadota bacterium]
MELVRGEDRVLLRPADPAPVFDLPDADLNIVSLEQFRDECNVVLYFYLRDYAPNCTMEAIEFSEREHEFSQLRTVVLGVSRDDCMTHGMFRDEHVICVQLLADPDGECAGDTGYCRRRK